MSTEGLSDLAALLFGAAIIVAYSFERFNRPSFDTNRRMQRLVDFLSPDKLRARRKVTFAYFVYTLTLIAIYLVLCAYGKILLPLLGSADRLPDVGASALPAFSPDAIPAASKIGYAPLDQGDSVVQFWVDGLINPPSVALDSSGSLGISPELSMGLALVIVGLAPAIPALTRVDEWLRNSAHRIAGIPTWAIDAADVLRSNSGTLKFLPPDKGDQSDKDRPEAIQNSTQLLIYEPERKLMEKIREGAKGKLGNSPDFLQNIQLIMVASAWFLDEKLHLPSNDEKSRFKDIENNLRERKIRLLHSAGGTLSHGDWEALAADADALADDFCILIALYFEHGVIRSRETLQAPSSDQESARNQMLKFIRDLYENRTAPVMNQRGSNLALFWSIGVVMTVSILWAVSLAGAAEFALQRNEIQTRTSTRVLQYAWTAFNTYCIAIIVAIAVRWMRRSSRPTEEMRTWENLRYPNHWTTWVPQAALVVSISWFVSAMIMTATYIWQSSLTSGWDNVTLTSVMRIFLYNSPICLRAALLALLILVLLDARQRLWISSAEWERRREAPKSKINGIQKATYERQEKERAAWLSLKRTDSLLWAMLGAYTMFFVGALTRFLSFRAGASIPGPTLESRNFDRIDMGLMFWAVIFCSILGATVMYCLSEALTSRSIGRKGLDEGPDAASPDGAA